MANFVFRLQMFHNLKASKHHADPGLLKHEVEDKQKWTFARFVLKLLCFYHYFNLIFPLFLLCIIDFVS